NGLVQLSPDTRTDGYMDWDGCGGYHYSDSVIHGFSHTHLSGTGVPDLCDVLLMPMSGEGGFPFDAAARSSRFDHASEAANAGYYRVRLLGPPPGPVDQASVKAARPTRGATAIDVELTATARVGVHRYTFPKDQPARLVLDLRHRDELLTDTTVRIRGVSPTEIVGERRSRSWARDQRLFYCIRFSAPVVSQDVMPDIIVWNVAGYNFGTLTAPLVVKVGISAVSIEGARKNLESEVPGWDFDAVRKQAEDAWNAKLGKVDITGGTREQQRTFYTALYHTYVAPYVFNDVDGNYRGMDGQVHHADHNVYTVFSLWDTFRALHPLMTILEPDMTTDFVRTFLLHYEQGGRLPVWELWGNETDCMIGYHSVSVIADAYKKGIRGFDTDLALKAMVASAMRDEPGLNAYRAKGYISSEDVPESVSKTLEYAYDDACIAGFAPGDRTMDTLRISGEVVLRAHADTLKTLFYSRGENWRNLYDPATGFFRARYNGAFKKPFDPYEVNFNFTEANAWQYSLFVPGSMERLIEWHGGKAGFEARLDALFGARQATSGREQADITGLIGQYAQGNEPSHHMAYLYNRAGRPDKTRALIKRILNDLYHDAPDGLSGNEDCGQMSAWYVMSALGLYQVSPGIDTRYDLGYPLFDKATIHLPNGRTWTMAVEDHPVEAVPSDTTWYSSVIPNAIWHEALKNGGEQRFDRDRVPMRHWYRPVTSVLDGAYTDKRCGRPGAPVIEASSAAFRDTLMVTVSGCGTCTILDSAGIRPCPMRTPFVLQRSATVQVDWSDDLAPVVAHFTRREHDRSIHLDSRYADQYAAGGEQALVDGLRGGNDFRTGEWQGYHDTDLVATIDLGGVKQLGRVGLSVFQDQNAWIWYPSTITIAWSADQHHWSSTTVENTVPRNATGSLHQELWSKAIGKRARYVKVVAHNAGPCPNWHPGRGGPTWIFADEVLIETK
ncbi:MAG TPA: GH92 family glycosyl hydrolase, partial [Flavobacteriales bacterium]|nr:GH92 family glycosyl hydrolase [Flavobacteriales bacterium]